jgi:hypothetical protein
MESSSRKLLDRTEECELKTTNWVKKYLVANATLFRFIISQIGIETSTFLHTIIFGWGLHGGVDVEWSGGVLVWELD